MRSLIYLLFFLSGFVGLIYEAIFSRYLKLFLGHSSYGQLLTIVVFMGGLGLGALIAGRFAPKVRNAFTAYALLEFGVAAIGVLFHPLYVGVTAWFYNNVDTFAGLPGGIVVGKVVISALLTVPCAMLLGMTFPLLAVGVMRLTQDGGKRSLPLLYFTNSFGAALGILATSYVLLRVFGTPYSLNLAACGNVLVGIGFLMISRRALGAPTPDASPESDPAPALESAGLPSAKLWLAIAFGTGFASFVYEIGWIRLLSLLMGSSTHSFDIMVSAFILGLACGGFFAKRLIARFKNIPALMAGVQVLMGIFALCSIYFYRPFFEAINASHGVLQNSEGAYIFYGGFKYLLALALMFPASFCAGITLPVITYYLCARSGGERYTGYVYGCNTVGAILGAVFGGLILLPMLQLKWTLAVGATLDIALGLLIVSQFRTEPLFHRLAWAAAAVSLLPLAFVSFEQGVVAGGAFRMKSALDSEAGGFVAVRDGRTATISLQKRGPKFDLATNGKSDGSVVEKSQRGKVRGGDDLTVAQLAFLPALTRTESYNCAIVGMGTGMTLHHLLGDERLEAVDLIEIEEAVLEISELIRPTNERAFIDPRVNFVVQDAKSYFYQSGKKYDLIISEPSNPWVSGVSSLFTKEYYQQLRRFLKPGGLLVQWAHTYEFSDDLAYSIMAALSEFPYFEIYGVSHLGDFMMIAGEGPFRFESFQRWEDSEGIRGDFAESKWSFAELGPANFIASSRTLRPLLKKWEPATNSDYFPYVDQHAEFGFFTKSRTTFQEVFFPGFGCYQELYEPERLHHLKSAFAPRVRPGYDQLPKGKRLRTLIRGLDVQGDWKSVETGLLATTAPYFYSGYWHELEPVVDYGKLVEDGVATEKYANRFRYLRSIATGKPKETARHLPAVVASFSPADKPDPRWLRSMIVNALKAKNRDLAVELVEDYVGTNPNFNLDEFTVIMDLMLRGASTADSGKRSEGSAEIVRKTGRE